MVSNHSRRKFVKGFATVTTVGSLGVVGSTTATASNSHVVGAYADGSYSRVDFAFDSENDVIDEGDNWFELYKYYDDGDYILSGRLAEDERAYIEYVDKTGDPEEDVDVAYKDPWVAVYYPPS